ncbi:MAG: type IX secretion system sortase PorU [Chlorobi bacterium]|nr:type IX secretion system sortase PorU [Chlorobiota bacterium]
MIDSIKSNRHTKPVDVQYRPASIRLSAVAFPATGMLRSTMIIVMVLLSYLADPLQAQTPDLRVIQSDQSGITIELRPQLSLQQVSISGKVYTKVEFNDNLYLSEEFAGTPDLRFFQKIVVLPGLTGHAISVIDAKYHDVPNVLLLPVPGMKKVGDEFVPFWQEGDRYRSSTSFLPVAIAEILNPGQAGNLYIAQVRLYPYQWNAATRSLRVYDHVVVRIDFGPQSGTFATTPDGELPLFPAKTLLNPKQARKWTIARTERPKTGTTVSMESGDWYKLSINQDGVYKLDANWFAQNGISIGNVDPRTIQLFGSGGRELPDDINLPRPDPLQEIAIEVIGEEDGRFDQNDYVLFYGKGLTGWNYDPGKKTYRHYIHRFAKTNSYLLTFGQTQGKRIEAVQGPSEPNPYRPPFFTWMEFDEQETVNFLHSGRQWFGPKITAGGTQVITRLLEGLVENQPITYRMVLVGRAQDQTTNSFSLADGGVVLGVVPMPTVDLGTDQSDIAAISPVQTFTRAGSLPDRRSNLRITYTASDPDRNEGGYVDWVEWHYAHDFIARGDKLSFTGVDTSAVIEYVINNFSTSDVRVYDITKHASVRRISNAVVSGGTVRFQEQAQQGTPSWFFVVASNAYLAPSAVQKVDNSNLLGASGAKALVIAPKVFFKEAERLAEYRNTSKDPISAMAVKLESIYNEFNEGLPDPAAIRNFLSYAFQNWQVPPQYVTLLGDGHFDYLGKTTSEPIRIPVWESENSTHLIYSYTSDDFFAKIVGNDPYVDVAIGRITAQTVEEARESVDKIIHYETGQDYSPWRGRVTFVADDGLTSNGDDGALHTSQAEDLANNIPPEFLQDKIYIVDYNTVISSQGRRKPDANKAIIESINNGTLVINYTGHGSEEVWAHERVFTISGSIPQLHNKNRFTFLVAATCTFGLYDRPDDRSGAEIMLLAPDMGLIGGVSSPRVVYSNENYVFNQIYLENLLRKGREADGRARRSGDALFATKQVLTNRVGFEKFYHLGDPAVRLLIPPYQATIDRILIDGVEIVDSIQIKARSRLTIEASVRDAQNTLLENFEGQAETSLFDADRNVPVEEWGTFSYVLPGGLLYRGLSSIKQGRFSVDFIVPKDISYSNSNGRLSIYFTDNEYDGIGFNRDFTVGGTDTTSRNDNTGPDIFIYLDTRDFRPGDLVNENANLIVDLYDDIGINTTGNGIGHSIEAWLDDSDESFILNDYYRGKLDSFQEGTVEYMLSNLTPGRHTLRVRAWDVENNSSYAETDFLVAESSNLTVLNVYNYPNPMSRETNFTFQHNQSGAIEVEIRIYTVTGRLIRILREPVVEKKFVTIPWDGTDEDGDVIANGVYFYRLKVKALEEGRTTETLGKLSIVR